MNHPLTPQESTLGLAENWKLELETLSGSWSWKCSHHVHNLEIRSCDFWGVESLYLTPILPKELDKSWHVTYGVLVAWPTICSGHGLTLKSILYDLLKSLDDELER